MKFVNIVKAFLKRNRPILEYVAAVWSPHLQYQIHQLEKVQCSAARIVMNDYA